MKIVIVVNSRVNNRAIAKGRGQLPSKAILTCRSYDLFREVGALFKNKD